MSRLTIRIKENQLQKIEKSLDGIKSPSTAIKTTINNTAKRAQKLLAEKTSKEYVGQVSKKGAILASSTILKAAAGNLTATIKFKSPIHDIKEFHVSSLQISRTSYRKDGKRSVKTIKGNVLKGSPKPLKGAFVVQFKSGHVAVVTREPGTHMVKNPSKEKLKKLLSPSYKSMIGSDKVYGATEKEIAEIMSSQVEQVISKALGGT